MADNYLEKKQEAYEQKKKSWELKKRLLKLRELRDSVNKER